MNTQLDTTTSETDIFLGLTRSHEPSTTKAEQNGPTFRRLSEGSLSFLYKNVYNTITLISTWA